MNDNEKLLKSLRRGQIANRILLIVILVFLLANFIVTSVIGVQIRSFVKMMEPAVEALTAIDVEGLNDALYTLNTAVDVFKVNEALETLNSIDFDGLGKVISGIDVDKLNNTLTRLDEASQFMQKIGDGMKQFLNQFGINTK